MQSFDVLPEFLSGTQFDNYGSAITGLAIPLDPDAMLWHNNSVVDITRCLTKEHSKSSDFKFIPLYVDGGWWIYAIATQLCSLPIINIEDRWKQPLPPLEQLVSSAVWPSVADVFCANSSSVHNHFRLPVLTKHGATDLVEWGSVLQIVAEGCSDETPSTPCTTTSTTVVMDDRGRAQVFL